ncbi:MAG: flagellar hook-associated protein FlgK [Roseburia sp.]|nr:flagellar hook-associated protein FlgK [Roseburia sp.]
MPSTFFGLTVASSGLRAFQAALNTSANNVSNVQTEGYTKQVANREAAEALRVHEKYGTAGSGVTTTSIKSIRNEYYDSKYWENQSAVGYYDTKVSYLRQIETYFVDDEESDNPGFNTIFKKLFNSMDGVYSHAEELSYRQDGITNAQILCNYFNNVGGSLARLQKDCNDQIKTLVDSINASSQKIASLTKQINDIELQGGRANELRDQRALVIDELSEIVPITVEESEVTNSNFPDMYTGGTYYLVRLDGQTIVNSFEYRTFTCEARENRVNQTDVDGLYDVVWSDTGMKFNLNATTMHGSLKALFEMRDGNNNENFQGKVTRTTGSTVTIRPTTQTRVEEMTMGQEGRITIGNRIYNYERFSAKLDENGNITEYTFELKEFMDDAQRQELMGKQAQIGDKIKFMGIPYYMGQMSEFLRNFTERFNAIQMSGQDLNGNPMESFFRATKVGGEEYDFHDQTVSTDGVTDGTKSVITSSSDSYYQLTALNVVIADRSRRDPNLFSTGTNAQLEASQDIMEQILKLESKVQMFRGDNADGFLKCILTDLAVDTNEAEIFQENFNDISASINTQRMSIAGVDEDEEALDLVKFQNAYNLASRMIQCMSEIYNKLINETGV